MKLGLVKIYFLLWCVNLLMLFPIFLNGQTENIIAKANILNLLSEDLSPEMLQFIQEENLLAELRLMDIIPFKDWRKLLSNQAAIESKLNRPPTQIRLQSLVLNHKVDTIPLDLPTNYTNIQIQSGLSFGKIPVKLNGRLVTADFKIQLESTNFSLDFNPLAYLNQLKKTYQPNPNLITQQSGLANFKQPDLLNGQAKLLAAFSPREQVIILNEVKFQVYQHLIAHPKFIDLVGKKDSLATSIKEQKIITEKEYAKGVPSPKNTRQKIRVDSIQQLIQHRNNQIDSLVFFYQKRWENRKSYYSDTLQVLKQKLNAYADEIDQYNNPDVLRQQILADKNQPLLTKILAGSKKIAIGQSIITDSWYTAQNLPINGIQYQFEDTKWFGTLAYGKQVYNNNFSPIWTAKLFNQVAGANTLMLKVGHTFSDKRSRITYTFIRLKEKGNYNQGIVLAPKNNAVFSVSGYGRINNKIGVNTSISFSRNIWGQTDLSNSNRISKENTAGEFTLSGNLLADDLVFDMGYYYVGANFIAAANPFLQNNQHGLVTKINGKIGKKLALSAEFKSGRSLNHSITGGTQTQFQLLGAFNWHPVSGLNISGQIAPNTFKHFGNGTASTSGENTLYNLQISQQQTINEAILLLSGGYTNYNTQWQYYDTTFVNKTVHFYFQPSFVLANQSQISLRSMLGIAKEEGQRQFSFFSELSYQFRLEKWKISSGVQTLKDTFSKNWYYGITNSSEIQLSETLALMTNISFQIPYEKAAFSKKRYWGQLELIKQF